METLTGHTGPETAYTVADYPYGFRLRTSKRYWVETKEGQGMRVVSQTLNPKTGRWNKPKASTYSLIKVLFLDAAGHVQADGLTGYATEKTIAEFERLHAVALAGNREREAIRYLRARLRAETQVTWKIHTCQPGCNEPHQTIQEQAAIMGTLTQRELWQETLDAIHEGTAS